MGLVETEAIVLRTYKLAEADKIAVLLTEKAGLVRGVARGARRLKSKFGAGLEPHTLAHVSYFEKEGRELVSIRHVEILRSYFGVARDEEALAVLDYFGELVLSFAPPGQGDARLFKMVRACVDAVASAEVGYEAVSSYFELWLLRLAGFMPDLKACGVCGRELGAGGVSVDIQAGSHALCGDCGKGGSALGPEAFRHLCASRVQGPAKWAAEFGGLSAQGRKGLREVGRRLIRGVLEREPAGGRAFTRGGVRGAA